MERQHFRLMLTEPGQGRPIELRSARNGRIAG